MRRDTDKATPSHFTKNGSFAGEISKNVVCVLISISRGVFIGVQGRVTNLVKSVTHQVVDGQPCGSVSTNFLHRLGLPLLM
jgi:hypothetical protein